MMTAAEKKKEEKKKEEEEEEEGGGCLEGAQPCALASSQLALRATLGQRHVIHPPPSPRGEEQRT